MPQFARRMSSVHKSFIREILKAAADPSIISFAGGLPNPRFFPIKELDEAAHRVLSENGSAALQYATTEGFPPLREKIAERYAARGVSVHPDDVLILNGSQQGLDLVAKVLIDAGDEVLLERPSYLAAIQCFGFFEPRFHGLTLDDGGVSAPELGEALRGRPKLFYAVPNFQNPTGITYSAERRAEVGRLMAGSPTVLVEDDPYGEIRFMGAALPPLRSALAAAGGDPGSMALLGTFSKIVSPGLRLGWLVTGKEIMEKVVTAKQAADLHSNEFTQRVVHRYLCDNDVERHIERIRAVYKAQRDAMVRWAGDLFPREVSCTAPEGGMFAWMTLPKGMSSFDFFTKAKERHVTFVPGKAFFADGGGENTLRLNFSCSDEAMIEEGMKRLAGVYQEMRRALRPPALVV
jgi:2-aminoadipate transaminase